MPDSQTHVLNCARCDTEPQNDTALFCRRCGAALPFERVIEHRVSGWKSIPGPIRFAIWVLVTPILIGAFVWAMIIFGVIVRAWLTTP